MPRGNWSEVKFPLGKVATSCYCAIAKRSWLDRVDTYRARTIKPVLTL